MSISGTTAWDGVGSRVTRRCSECGKKFQMVAEKHAYHINHEKFQCSYHCWRTAQKKHCESKVYNKYGDKTDYPRDEIIQQVIRLTREAADLRMKGYDDLRKRVVSQRTAWLGALEEQMMREIEEGDDKLADTGH